MIWGTTGLPNKKRWPVVDAGAQDSEADVNTQEVIKKRTNFDNITIRKAKPETKILRYYSSSMYPSHLRRISKWL